MKPLTAVLALAALAIGANRLAAQPVAPGVASAIGQASTAPADTRSIYGSVPCPAGSPPGPLCESQPGLPERFAEKHEQRGALPIPESWYQPVAPFHIIGNIYYVGTVGLAAYLFASPNGLILLDGTMRENVTQIERNIATLGFRLGDVKILINSHAHFDHAGGLRQLKQDTGAQLLASAGDRGALESGVPPSNTS